MGGVDGCALGFCMKCESAIRREIWSVGEWIKLILLALHIDSIKSTVRYPDSCELKLAPKAVESRWPVAIFADEAH